MSEAGKTFRRWRPALVVGIGLMLVTALIWLAIEEFAVPDKGKKKRVIQEISLIKPPPPPPKKIEKPPKPEIKEKVDVPKPDQQPDKPADAPPPDTGIPEGPAGGMATDLGVGSGSGVIGGDGSRFAWYGALIKERIQETVARDIKLREADYRVVVNVWVNASGTVTRAELIGSTGDAELDSALKVTLRNLPPLREGAPADMPQPIKLRITARS